MPALAEYGTTRTIATLLLVASGITGCKSVSRDDGQPSALPRHTRFSIPLGPDADLPHATTHPRLEAAGFVDWHLATTRRAWQAANTSEGDQVTSWAQYNQHLAGLLDAATTSARLDPGRGFLIRDGDTIVTIPVVYHGFPWAAGDFQRLFPPPPADDRFVHRHYACPGIGVPLIVERSRIDHRPIEARFYPEMSAFSATAVLRFDADGAAVLEFYNPLDHPRLELANGSVPIARNLTASFVWALQETPRTYLVGLFYPDQPVTSPRLSFLEPYQPGKIPVVIIHGLFSDPQSFADLTNDLRASPGFADNFQVWHYRYPTGQGILQSARALRDELHSAVLALDPDGADHAMRQMVLIGHSMGGLIAKLQVTYAEERIWSRVANRPLEEVLTTEPTRAELAQVCFFDPAPHVARVIFMCTPHHGALPSTQIAGKGTAMLVKPPARQTAMHRQLIMDNPGTFQPWIERRFPTSVDMLAENSPLLDAMWQMRIGDRVALHNIVGVSHAVSRDGPSDGIVSVNSALHPDCESLLAVDAPHAQVHRSLATSMEVLRILRQSLSRSAQFVERR